MSATRRRPASAIDGRNNRSFSLRRARGWRRLAEAVLIAASGAAALALAGPMALRPFMDASETAGAAGLVSVAFVLDFGPGSTPVVGCVSVPASDNRYDALAAFVTQSGMASPSYASSGLLCSINAVPSTGCGQIVAGGYVYWSYFTGANSGWTYANSGASGGVTPGDVEGWRFQNPGKGNPSDPAPRSAPLYDSICAPVTVTTTSNPVASGGEPSTVPQVPLHPGSGAAPAPIGSGGTGGSSTSTTSNTTSTSPHPSTTTEPSTTATTTTTTYPAISDTSVPAVSVPASPASALGVAKPITGSSGPGSGPLIIGGLLIAALGIGAFARWRKRFRTP
jgi:hypothetical protein